MDTQTAAVLRQIAGKLNKLDAQVARMTAQMDADAKILHVLEALRPPRSVTQDIDAIDGRRIFYNLNGRVGFTIADLHQRGEPVTMQVSQDGPFVMTHYPLAWWLPSAPANADNLGRWSPVTSTPLPTQQVGSGLDTIDISWELVDGGSQRNLQNAASPPILSRIDNLVPLPVPTLFTPNSVVQFFPTYESINFATASTHDTTDGILVVGLPGYRIVNL